jgi:hypothetical protein
MVRTNLIQHLRPMLQSISQKGYIILLALFIFAGCAGDGEKKTTADDAESLEAIEQEVNEFYSQNITYKLPSPVEFYIFLEDNGASYQKDLINSAENKAKYYTVQSKTLNFGIFVSDLAYSTVFGQHQETFSYFKITRELADELGYAEGFDKALVQRVENNQYNLDSLYQISNDAYWDACNYLEDQERRDALALIYTGGWLESVYLAVNSVTEFDLENPVVVRIAEQQILLDNLIGTMYSLDPDMQPQEILDKLIGLQEIFDQLYDNTDVVITQEQFDEISNAIKSFRNEIVS